MSETDKSLLKAHLENLTPEELWQSLEIVLNYIKNIVKAADD